MSVNPQNPAPAIEKARHEEIIALLRQIAESLEWLCTNKVAERRQQS